MNTNTSISNILHPNKKHKQQIIKNLFTHPNTLPKVIFDHVIILFKQLMVELTQLEFTLEYSKNNHMYNWGVLGEGIFINKLTCSYCDKSIDFNFPKCNICNYDDYFVIDYKDEYDDYVYIN
jgi:hypothetical protein